jgi:hypothetical protein
MIAIQCCGWIRMDPIELTVLDPDPNWNADPDPES